MSTVGHSHGTRTVVPPTHTPSSSDTSTSGIPGHTHVSGLRLVIAHSNASASGAGITAGVPEHSHNNSTANATAPGSSPSTPGHSHGLHLPLSPATGSPVHPRPSARVSRRSGLFSTADDARNEEHEDTVTGTEAGHPLFDVPQNTTMPPTLETEEPPSAELDGQFEQPARGHHDQHRGEESTSDA
ncbi:hypothetical protein BD413DRAFT_615858 [Trametes elegans]|nr:hypothetical protein BD413DRAFT_615858 [Trametes elegans]